MSEWSMDKTFCFLQRRGLNATLQLRSFVKRHYTGLRRASALEPFWKTISLRGFVCKEVLEHACNLSSLCSSASKRCSLMRPGEAWSVLILPCGPVSDRSFNPMPAVRLCFLPRGMTLGGASGRLSPSALEKTILNVTVIACSPWYLPNSEAQVRERGRLLLGSRSQRKSWTHTSKCNIMLATCWTLASQRLSCKFWSADYCETSIMLFHKACGLISLAREGRKERGEKGGWGGYQSIPACLRVLVLLGSNGNSLLLTLARCCSSFGYLAGISEAFEAKDGLAPVWALLFFQL